MPAPGRQKGKRITSRPVLVYLAISGQMMACTRLWV